MKNRTIFIYDRETFGEDLRALREAQKMSRKQLSIKSKVSYQTIKCLEIGSRNPLIPLLVDVLRPLGVGEIRIEVPNNDS